MKPDTGECRNCGWSHFLSFTFGLLLGVCAGIGIESETTHALARALDNLPQPEAGLNDADGCLRR